MNGSPRLLVDGHVHFHPCFSWKTFLDAAAANFAVARRKLNLPGGLPGCLMFTESSGVHYYRSLRDDPGVASGLGWNLVVGDDGGSIMLMRRDGETILVVAGRQIVTREKLEVLALGCERELPDGRPVETVLADVASAAAVAVIPWGFGKWLGRRGRLLRSLLDGRDGPRFFLGDNGGRPGMVSLPRLFQHAERRGRFLLPGSDPLPAPAHVRRPGSYGFVLDGWRGMHHHGAGMHHPAAAVKTSILSLAQSPSAFGELSSFGSAIRSQLELRWRRSFARPGNIAPAESH